MNIIPQYLFLVFLHSASHWPVASIPDTTKIIPVALAFSAMQFLAIILASIIVTRRSAGSERGLLSRGNDMKRIENPRSRMAIYLHMPINIALSYLLILWSGAIVPDKMITLVNIPVLLLVYGKSGYWEQMGWTAILTEHLLKNHTVILTGPQGR